MKKRNNVRALRIKAGMTQAEVANACGIHYTSVVKWETGHNNPSPEQALTLREKFGWSLDDIYARPPA